MAAEKKTRKPRAAAKVHEIGSLEKWVPLKLHRRELKSAPYNPRIITDDERARLSEIIEAHGLVGPPTWNKRTGNLVGGHQRIAALDSLYGTDDYEITVACIDVDDDRERELNIALNNVHAMGDFDLPKLEQMFKDAPTMRIEATGFDAGELFRVFGASPFENRIDDALSEVAQKIRDARKRQAETKSKVKSREETDFYLVVVFANDTDRDAFCDQVGWEQNRYQDGRQLRVMCRDWIAERAAASEGAGDHEGKPDGDPQAPQGAPQSPVAGAGGG